MFNCDWCGLTQKPRIKPNVRCIGRFKKPDEWVKLCDLCYFGETTQQIKDPKTKCGECDCPMHIHNLDFISRRCDPCIDCKTSSVTSTRICKGYTLLKPSISCDSSQMLRSLTVAENAVLLLKGVTA